jgi:hypothetical protein
VPGAPLDPPLHYWGGGHSFQYSEVICA